MERYNITLTRFTFGNGSEAQSLGYMKWASDWRLIVRDESGDAVVGPLYKTKAELLGDLGRYAGQYGFEGDAPVGGKTLTGEQVDKIRSALEASMAANQYGSDLYYELIEQALAILKPEVGDG